MTEPAQKVKSFEELTDIYHKYKLLSKIENNVEEAKLEPVFKYVTDMCKELQDDSTDFMLKLQTIKGSLLYDEARVLLANHKTFMALEKLRKALYLVKPHKANPKLTYLYFRILNQLAYFLAQNNELDESLDLLEEAEILYEQLDNKSEILVFDTDDLFQETCPRKKRNALKFEKLITNNLHLQGWIYNRKQLTDKFIIYCHMVLKRQLETQDSSALLWVFKCARLASYFFGVHRFSEARYLLAASYYVLREYELDLLKRRADIHFAAEWANLQKYYADLGKYWVKYGLFLLDASRRSLPNSASDTALNDVLIKSFKESLPRKSFHTLSKSLKEKLQTIEEKPEEQEQELPRNNESLIKLANNISSTEAATAAAAAHCNNNENMNKDIAEITKSIIDLIDDQLKDEDNDRKYCIAKYMSMLDNLNGAASNVEIGEDKEKKEVGKGSNYKFTFPSLSLHDIESKVTCELLQGLEDARHLFLFTQDWLKRSKAYYNIQDFPLDYINLILDLNDLYRYLSLYEIETEAQYDVQKRRVDLLEKLTLMLKEYRPNFYLTLNIELVNELTQAQIELVLLNLRRLNSTPSPSSSPTALQQSNPKEEVYRKMEALLDIRKRLSRKESPVSYCSNKMVASLNEPDIS